jgi:MFS family permease
LDGIDRPERRLLCAPVPARRTAHVSVTPKEIPVSTPTSVHSDPVGGPAAGPWRAAARRHGAGFWLIAASLLISMAFSAAPAPLYVLYERRDHFSTFIVTVVFAVYGIGVVVSLLLAGHVSDWVGRKRILIPAIGVEVLAAVLFLAWPDLPVLIAARLINGVGVGMITATATAHLHELHTRHRPAASPARFEVVSTAANIGGLGAGPLLSGFLAQYVAQPLRVPYLVFAVLLLLSVVAVGLTPETVEERLERPAWRPQRVGARGDTARYLIAAGGAFSAFAVLGLFTSLAPGFVGGTLHHPSRLLAGVSVFLVFGAAAAAQTATGRMRPAPRTLLGAAATAGGLIMVAAGMATTGLALFLVGGAIAGAGAGVLFKAAIGSVAAAAAPEARGEAMAGLFLISYLGLIVPVVGIGIAAEYLAPTTAMDWFTGLLLALLGAVTALAVYTHTHRDPAERPYRTESSTG